MLDGMTFDTRRPVPALAGRQDPRARRPDAEPPRRPADALIGLNEPLETLKTAPVRALYSAAQERIELTRGREGFAS